MNLKITDSFLKSFGKLNNPGLQIKLSKVITSVETAQKITDIPNLKKLSGYKNLYRIRTVIIA